MRPVSELALIRLLVVEIAYIGRAADESDEMGVLPGHVLNGGCVIGRCSNRL